MGSGVNGHTFRRIWRVLRQTIALYGRYDTSTRAAALAYYSLLSIFPLLLLLISLIGRWLSSASAQQVVFALVQQVIPIVPELISENVEWVLARRGSVNVVAGVSLAWSASSLFAAIIHSLDRVWSGEPGRTFWEHRLLSIGLVGAVVILFIFSSVLTAVLSLVPRLITMLVPIRADLVWRGWRYAPALVSLGMDVFLYAMLYRFLPSRFPPWPAVWAGAVVAGIGWNAMKVAFAWYLGHFARYGLVYGTLATLVAFLFWVYLSGVVLLVGAEFGAAWAQVWGLDEEATAQG